MTIAIRRAAAVDAARLALVARAAFLETYAHMVSAEDMLAYARNQNSEAYFARWLEDARAALWLAELGAGAAPIGFAGLSAPDLPVETSADDIELKRIYVLHRFQRDRVGARLLEVVIDHARAAGKKRMLLGTHQGNESALAFYARNGFSKIGVRTFTVGDATYDDYVLASRI